MAWIDEVKRYDIDGLRKHVGIRTVNGAVSRLGLGHQRQWYRDWKGRATLGRCVDFVAALGGGLVDSDLFEVVVDGERRFGRFSDFEINKKK